MLLNIAAQYSLIDEHVLEIAGDAEAFFSAGDPADWYLHLGERPLDDRISVTVLSLFEALGYLSIEQTGLATGFRIGYGESRRFGKLELGFDVHISGDGALSFDRLSVHGKGELAGSIHASAFGVGMSLAAQASVAASAFSPLSVSAEAKVEVDLPTPLPTLSPDVKLVWRNTKKPAYANPFTALRLVHPATAEEWEPATGETAAPVVPMDARPVLTLSHAVADALGIGQPAAYVTDPPPETVGDYEIRYTLTGVTLEYRPLGGGAFVPVDDLYGVWLLEGAAPADDPAEAEGTAERVTTKLELWGRTPFSYEDHTTVPTLSTAVADDPAFPCGPDVDLTPTCTDWQEDRPRTRYPLVFTHGGLEFGSNRVTEVAAEPPLTEDTGLDRALALRPDTSLVGALPGPCSGVTTLVESLGTVIVEAWGRSPDGAATLLESHTIHGRNEGLLTIAATGVEQLVYRARPSEDCAPWSWQLPGTTTGIHSGQGEAVPDDPNLPSPITTVPCSNPAVPGVLGGGVPHRGGRSARRAASGVQRVDRGVDRLRADLRPEHHLPADRVDRRERGRRRTDVHADRVLPHAGPAGVPGRTWGEKRGRQGRAARRPRPVHRTDLAARRRRPVGRRPGALPRPRRGRPVQPRHRQGTVCGRSRSRAA